MKISQTTLIRDYKVPPEKVNIVPNPIDLDHFVPDISKKHGQDKFLILFVSRIAVRKGVEMVVELSHRLTDLADTVEIRVVGDKSLWSDYTELLRSLNPKIANYAGSVSGSGMDMVHLYQSADILVQPSRYEPFGLTVGEALACGTPVVASDKIGSAEHVDNRVCRIFEDGNMDAFEYQVRQLIAGLSDEYTTADICSRSRFECERLYAGDTVAERLLSELQRGSRKDGQQTDGGAVVSVP